MAGVTIPNCALTLEKPSGTDKDTRITTRGSVLCTHVGISGPPVINISTDVSDVLPYTDVVLRLNLFPEYSVEKISAMILEHIESMPSSYLFNVLRKIMHAHLADHILTTFSLTRDMQSLTLPKAKRFEIARYLKSIPIHVEHLLGSDKAIVTRGGVPLSEIHTKTCESTLHTGLFIIGDLLDINRPSGGYSLQLCWTTGHVAGVAAAKRL
jgi:predicted Rossmann fold flavoprotein